MTREELLSATEPLYTVVVTCYNQEEFIVECLESVKDQDYAQVELIVCDDKSSDNTVIIAERWLNDNKDSFVRSELLVNAENLGISGNHNAGLSKATGKYISFIHGDDKLYNHTSLTDAIDFIQAENLTFTSLRIRAFLDCGNGKYELQELLPAEKALPLFKQDPLKQFRSLLTSCWIPGVLVIETDFLREIGGFDEEFRSAEDWCLWLKLSRTGYRIGINDKPFLFYRRHPKSITVTSIAEGKSDFVLNKLKAIEKYIFPFKSLLRPYDRWSVYIYYRYLNAIVKFGCSKQAYRKARWIKLFDPIKLFKSLFF